MNYLYFNNGGNDSRMYPASALRGVDLTSNTNMDLYFESAKYTTNPTTKTCDKISLTIVDDQEEITKEGLVQAINDSLRLTGGLAVIADEANSIFCHPNITAIASITDAPDQ